MKYYFRWIIPVNAFISRLYEGKMFEKNRKFDILLIDGIFHKMYTLEIKIIVKECL